MDSNIDMNQFNDFMEMQNPPCAAPPQIQNPHLNQKATRKQKPKQTQTQTSAVIKKHLAEPNRKYANAYVKVVEQPASKAVRFRYECEGRSAGSILGVNSTLKMRTYPTIEIVGYKGPSVCVVSCVSKESPYRPHPHNLVGKEGCKRGVYTFNINEDTMRAELSNLGIQCIKRKDIEASLKTREEIRVDPFKTGFSHATQPGNININAVRLCFQVFIPGEKGHFTVPLKPVVSDPIYDKKAKSDLIILEMCSSATVLGNTQIVLLCEKVTKEDIAVRFFEEKNGVVIWEAYGHFEPSDVHKQTAIGLKTPEYYKIDIEEPVSVFVQLQRPSDGAVSKPWKFKYEPVGEAPLKRKHKRTDLTMGSLKTWENQTGTNKQHNITKDETAQNLDLFHVTGEMTPSLQPLSSTRNRNSSKSPSRYSKVTEVINLESGTPTTLENPDKSKVYPASDNFQQVQFSKLQNIPDQPQEPFLDELLQQPNWKRLQQQQLHMYQQLQNPTQTQLLPQQSQQPQAQQMPQQEQLHLQQYQILPPQLQVQQQQLFSQPLQFQQSYLAQQQQLPQQPLHLNPEQESMEQQQLQQQQLRLTQQLQQQFLGNNEVTNWDEKYASILALATAALSSNPISLPHLITASANTMTQGDYDMIQKDQYNYPISNIQQQPLQPLQPMQPPPPMQQQQQQQQQQPQQQQQQQQFLLPQQQQSLQQQETLSQTQFQQQSHIATSSDENTLVDNNDEACEEVSTISQLLNLDSDQLGEICDDTLLHHAINDDLEMASLTLSV